MASRPETSFPATYTCWIFRSSPVVKEKQYQGPRSRGGWGGFSSLNNFGKKSRATCFQRVIDNYDALLKLWNDCLETRLESYIRGRIIGCQAQMKKFDFFFGLNLSQRIFSHTDNLSETLQKAGISATSGQHTREATATVTSPNKRFNEQNNGCARAL